MTIDCERSEHMFKRAEKSFLTSWYFEVDRTMIVVVLALMLVGMWAAVTAGSVSAERMNPPQPWHFFFVRMIPFYFLGIGTLIISSMFGRKLIMLTAAANVIVMGVLLIMTFFEPIVMAKGSARWISVFGFAVTPSDLMKPGFIVITAWFLDRLGTIAGAGKTIFSMDKKLWRWDGWPAYLLPFSAAVFIMFGHPDIGTAALYFAVLAAVLLLAGLPWKLFFALGAVPLVGGIIAFMTWGHFQRRILSFFGLEGGADTFQLDQSIRAIRHGGLFGAGEDAFVKQSIPDSHTDFIFSAIAEDLGAIAAAILIIVFLYVMKKIRDIAMTARDRFVFYVAGGTLAMFGAQTFINIGSSLGVIPTKGMTLPFVSFGGSSFMAFSLMFGILLALAREDKWK